jgi:integrating conjugative element protein (TIGR03749 family)
VLPIRIGVWPSVVSLLLLALLIRPQIGHSTEVVQWQRVPIAVALHVGQERILFLDRPMRVAVPSSLAERLRVQSAAGAIYLRATTPFEPTRIDLQDADTGALVLLDVTASQDAEAETLEPVRILINRHTEDGAAEQESTAVAGADRATLPTPPAVLLTRYAAQSLYAPLRTVEPLIGIAPIPVRRTLDLSTLLPSLPVTLTLLAGWRLQDHWVTALRLTNLTSTWLRLDPRTLQGDFVSATFQHQQVGPHGDSTDTTVLYLVTRGHGLTESLLPAISPMDAAANLSKSGPSESRP